MDTKDLDQQHQQQQPSGDQGSDHDFSLPPPQRRLRGFAAAVAGGGSPVAKGRKEREREKERTKLRERHRRAITSRMLAGLRQYGNFLLPARADMNDVLAALAREAGWIVDPDGTTYRPSPAPASSIPSASPPPPPSQLAPFPIRSSESPLSATSLKNCSIKASLDSQAALLRIDETLSPTSFDSVVAAEGNIKNEKYVNASPVNSPDSVEPDQLMQEPAHDKTEYAGTSYVPVYAVLLSGIMNSYCQLVNPEAVRQELRNLKSLSVDGVVVDCWWRIVEGWSPCKYNWSGYRDLFNIIREFKLKLQVVTRRTLFKTASRRLTAHNADLEASLRVLLPSPVLFSSSIVLISPEQLSTEPLSPTAPTRRSLSTTMHVIHGGGVGGNGGHLLRRPNPPTLLHRLPQPLHSFHRRSSPPLLLFTGGCCRVV